MCPDREQKGIEAMTKRKKRKEIARKRIKRTYVSMISRCNNVDDINGIVYYALFDRNLTPDDMTYIQAIGEFVSDYILKGGNRIDKHKQNQGQNDRAGI